MDAPKEDEDAVRARKRERRTSMMERRSAAEDQAAGLSSDIQSVYGLQPGSGTQGVAKKKKGTSSAPVIPQISDFRAGLFKKS